MGRLHAIPDWLGSTCLETGTVPFGRYHAPDTRLDRAGNKPGIRMRNFWEARAPIGRGYETSGRAGGGTESWEGGQMSG